MVVKCLNCGILWRRVTVHDVGAGATGPPSGDYQYNCPACLSNYYTPVWGEIDPKPVKPEGEEHAQTQAN